MLKKMNNNPFKEGSRQYHDFEVMSDLKWHCTKCELLSGQAKTWQVWRQELGIQLDQDDDGKYYKYMYCEHCGTLTVHRKLKSTEILDTGLKARTTLPSALAARIKTLYGCVDEYSMRVEPTNRLEIDHRVPQVRWTGNEEKNDVNMTDEEIKEKFMLLARENNELKSRVCEECAKSGLRGKGYRMIEYWYEGDRKYDPKIGCKGCFWHNPTEWREKLNQWILDSHIDDE